MLLYSVGVTLDGFINDREGGIDWSVPDDELFAFHLERVRELGAILLGRRLYETMLVWETDESLRSDEAGAAFADVWQALPKVVFSRTLREVQGNARLARGVLADEVAEVLSATARDVEIGGADLAGQAISLGLVDELRLFRYPVIIGGGTPALPPVAAPAPYRLVETRTFGPGIIHERYRRAPGG
jgi:dihydrofolate reductase